MEYKILNDTNSDNLSLQVNNYLNDGWSLYGPLNVISINYGHSYDTTEFYQTMIKEDKKISCKCGKPQEAFE